MDNKTQLSVSTEVLEKMATLAAQEIDGVKGIAKKAIDIKGAIKSKSVVKGVKVESVNGAITITIYICVDANAKIREVSEAVQQFEFVNAKILGVLYNGVAERATRYTNRKYGYAYRKKYYYSETYGDKNT